MGFISIVAKGLAWRHLIASVLMAVTSMSSAHAELPARIQTDKGTVIGTVLSDSARQVMSYRGIPYAAPPVGDLRWRPPQPVQPWTGERDARLFSPMCAQPFPAGSVSDRVPESGMSEDCLYLNVTTAAADANARQPVMVWFHGGSLTSGWGNGHSPNSAPLPQRGVVLVSVNHRLGPLGYFSHPALSAESPQQVSGNYGALDTIAALEWVRDNIAAFGGDPDNVTIFGVSGGGEKVLFLMASPLAQGLFHRAIVMSGGIAGFPLPRTEQMGLALAEKLGINPDGTALQQLRATAWQDLVTAADDRRGQYRAVFTLDGWSLPGLKAHSDIPVMLGFMGGEKDPDTSPPYIARAITPAIEDLTQVYAYVFTHIPYGWGSRGGLAYHGGDVSYAFGTLENIPSHYGNLFRPPARLNVPADPQLDARDAWVSDAMMSMLVQFARYGDPNLDDQTFARLGKSWRWPRLDWIDQYLDIGVKPVVKTGWVLPGTNQQRPRYDD